MSQTIPKKTTLQDIVGRASYILIVKKTEPFVEYEDVSIGDEPSKYPIFKKKKFNFVVVDKLDKLHNGPNIGDAIVAVHADTYKDLEMHKLYYLEAKNKSKFTNAHATEANFNEENELIIFISLFSHNEYIFFAFESISKLDEIKNIFKNSSNTSHQPTISQKF